MKYVDKISIAFFFGCLAIAVFGAIILTVMVPLEHQNEIINVDSTPSANPEIQESYEGKLSAGISMFHNGEAIVELTFEDGRIFTAQEQMAAEANMQIGNTYQIKYSNNEPTVAINIQELEPEGY